MYGKIFESMFNGSMVGAGPTVFATWAYVIANVRPPGEIEINPTVLATIIGCPVEEINQAIVKLCAPDKYSRSQEHDGRRLLHAGAFSYAVPTFEKYRKMRNKEERNEYMADFMRNKRTKPLAKVSKR